MMGAFFLDVYPIDRAFSIYDAMLPLLCGCRLDTFCNECDGASFRAYSSDFGAQVVLMRHRIRRKRVRAPKV